MHGPAAWPAALWNTRKIRDNSARRAARAAVDGLLPAAVVTGASRGIGLELAREFRRQNHAVLLISRHHAELATAANALENSGNGRLITLACDITSDNALEQIDACLAREGCYLDVVINNAAMGLSGPFYSCARVQIEQLIALNITALTRLSHHALPGQIARGRGGILNIASLGGFVPGPHQAAYYASKSYVISLTVALANELSGTGVRIAVVAPGPVATSFHAAMDAESAFYRYLLPELAAGSVARSSYRGFKFGQRVIIPGPLYHLLYFPLRMLPYPISVSLMGWLLKNRK